ncbi:hypothetical protein GCM10023322_20020 [Rugosimonospora acidiphila]|uniref:SnoaL-like domain-containing protein n=1 Tax=Rugosimonospora acidiphila TaxID=556531 RepID=A0ABP9RQ01_9ACTN
MTSDVGAQADKAYGLYLGGLRDGQWQGFHEVLADEVDLVWPYPPSAGHYTGADGRQKLMVFLDQFGDEGNRIVESEVLLRVIDGDRVIFEDHGKGTLFRRPYEGRHCIIFVMSDGRVAGFHEYTARVA